LIVSRELAIDSDLAEDNLTRHHEMFL